MELEHQLREQQERLNAMKGWVASVPEEAVSVKAMAEQEIENSERYVTSLAEKLVARKE